MKKMMILFLFITFQFSDSLFCVDHNSNDHVRTLISKTRCKKDSIHHCCRPCPPGPPGPPGPSFTTFISLYALGQQTIPVGDPILFDAVSAQNGPITWPGANNGEIIISNAGTYRISFGIQPLFNVKISLRVNNVNVPGGTLSIDLSLPFSGLTLDLSLVIPPNSTISLVNTGNTPAILQSAGPDSEATIAFIEIHQIL